MKENIFSSEENPIACVIFKKNILLFGKLKKKKTVSSGLYYLFSVKLKYKQNKCQGGRGPLHHLKNNTFFFHSSNTKTNRTLLLPFRNIQLDEESGKKD